MKLYYSIIALLIVQLTFSQLIDLSEDQLLKSGNVFLKKFNSKNSEIKGNPYLNEKFQKGNILFNNGKRYNALIRLDVANQKFEIKKNLNSEISSIEVDNSVIVTINEDNFKNHSFEIKNKVTNGILKECLITDKYQLYFYPGKAIEMPNKDGIKAPPTGFTKAPQSKWKDASSYLIFHNGKTYLLPTSHKKMVSLRLFDEKLYKKYRKSNKLNLKKEESLIKLVSYFNSI
ncbi:hypothetical protein N9475_04595 [Flavobacteriaceae bacterium]|jgi:hypothetical protein|nr:hypothetical protein [Flavobacteriaceae bacterium]MDB4014248.1 hypothetical protein [Flavobacteriaceae bacterium]